MKSFGKIILIGILLMVACLPIIAFLIWSGSSTDAPAHAVENTIEDTAENTDDSVAANTPIPSPPANDSRVDPVLVDLMDMFEDYIAAEGLGDSIEIVLNGDVLLITLGSDIMHDHANAVILPETRLVGEALADMLRELNRPENPFGVVVEGHTDDVPISTERYPSNWHLSVDRAVGFLEILIKHSGLDPGNFSASGSGEGSPRVPNDSSENRALNRRIEILISLNGDDGFDTRYEAALEQVTERINLRLDELRRAFE